MNMDSDEVGACSSTSEISETFNVPGTSQSCSDLDPSEIRPSSGLTLEKRKAHRLNLNIQTSKIPRKCRPVRIFPKSSASDSEQPNNDPTFPKRKITTIYEEGMYFRTMHMAHRNEISRGKAHKARVAAFRALMGRLAKMANKKPEMLQDTLSDETIKLFKSIQIK